MSVKVLSDKKTPTPLARKKTGERKQPDARSTIKTTSSSAVKIDDSAKRESRANEGADAAADLRTVPASSTDTALLSVKQLAELLHINEKKVYQLAAQGDIPCTKVTGKWLFPRQLVLDWVEQNSEGGTQADRLALSGADDLLLDRVCRRLSLDLGRSAMLSYNPSGSMHGLRLLAARKTDGCFFHWGATGNTGNSSRRHFGLLRSFREHTNWISVRCFLRHEGLALSSEVAQSLTERKHTRTDAELSILKQLGHNELRWAQRHHESGTQRLLEDMCAQCDVDYASLGQNSNYYAGERETAAAILHNQADVALTSEAVALEYNLDFVKLDTVAIDLVMSRKTFFRPIVQQLLKQLLHTGESVQQQWANSYQIPDNHEVQIVKK